MKFTSSQVVDTKASPLCYCYEDVSDPLAATGGVMAAAVGAGAANPNAGNMADQPIPEMIGATDQPIVLTGPTNVSLALTAPTGPAALAAAAPGASTAAAGRLHLNIENITGSGDPVAYEVYVNVPAGENPREHPELFAGLMPMFGVAESSQADEHHSGSGLHYAFDVTDIVRALAAKNAWDANNVQLTFVPQPSPVPEGAAPLAGAAAAAGPQSAGPFQVGRVSLYVA